MSTDAPKKPWTEGIEAVDRLDTTVVKVEGINGDVGRMVDDLRGVLAEAGFIATGSDKGITMVGTIATRPDILAAALKGIARVHPEMRVTSNGTMLRRTTSAIPLRPEDEAIQA